MKWLILILLLSSCGPAAKLRRAEKLIAKAEAQGAVWHSDTIVTIEPVKFPAVTNEFQFDFPKADKELVFITEDSTILKLEKVLVPADSAGIIERYKATITTPEREKEVPTSTVINREIVAPKPYWNIWKVGGAFLFALVIGFIVGKVVK